MPRARVMIVARLGPGKAMSPFMIGSLLIHAALIIAMVIVPRLGQATRIPEDALIVELAPAFPARAAPAPSSAPAPKPVPPEPRPTEEVRVEPDEPPEIVRDPPREEPRAEEPPATPEPTEGPESLPAPGEVDAGPAGEAQGGPAAGSLIVPLSGGDLRFAWYRASVTAALYSNWQRPILRGLREPVEVTVAFRIQPDGSVSALRLEGPSGLPSLDRSALRAVSDAAPLPPLPSNWLEPHLEAVFVFRLYPDGY